MSIHSYCPVCGSWGLSNDEHSICSCCGVHFDYDDYCLAEDLGMLDNYLTHSGSTIIYAKLREDWIAKVCSFMLRKKPENWSLEEQLKNIMSDSEVDNIIQKMKFMKFNCPICGFSELEEPPYLSKDSLHEASFETCGCCGVEFGCEDYFLAEDLDMLDDFFTPDGRTLIFKKLREEWIAKGYSFKHRKKPKNWSLETQLKNIMTESEVDSLIQEMKSSKS